MNKRSANETLVRSQKLELAMHEGEQLFLERCLPQTRVSADGRNRLVHFLFEEMERDVFLALEIVEDGTFGNAGLARDRFCRRGIETLRLKKVQRRSHNALPDRFLALRAPSHRTGRRATAARFRS